MTCSSGWAARSGLTRVAWVMAAVLALAVGGCGDPNPLSGAKLYPVKGKVVLPDGKPLSSGQVVFVGSKSMITSPATIESDGSFTFKGASADGLPEGDYKIRIEGGSASGGKKGKANNPFADQFLDEDTSELTATVTSDEEKNNFELKLNPTKKTEGGGDARRGRPMKQTARIVAPPEAGKDACVTFE